MKTLNYLAFLCLFFYACNSRQTPINSNSLKNDSLSIDTTEKNVSKNIDTIESLPNWDYDTTVDEMTSKKTITATTTATNSFEFREPYDGYNSAVLCVRKRRGVTDMYLKIDKGQFIFGVYGTDIKVRFDEHPYNEYSCNRATDYDPTIIFINDAETFIGHLYKAQKVIVEANIYDNGYQQFEFKVDGFKWGNPKRTKKKSNGIDLTGFTVGLPKDGKEPPKKKGFISLTGTNRKGHDTVIYVKGDENTINQ